MLFPHSIIVIIFELLHSRIDCINLAKTNKYIYGIWAQIRHKCIKIRKENRATYFDIGNITIVDYGEPINIFNDDKVVSKLFHHLALYLKNFKIIHIKSTTNETKIYIVRRNRVKSHINVKKLLINSGNYPYLYEVINEVELPQFSLYAFAQNIYPIMLCHKGKIGAKNIYLFGELARMLPDPGIARK